eukprot:Gb_01127 [translate_table: standard]
MGDRMKWCVDGKLLAGNVRNARSCSDLIGAKLEERQICRNKLCSACGHQIECDEANQDWPGLPLGVKFDPTDQELLEHLEGKVGIDNFKPHPLIDEFIPTLEGEDGICYTHPEKLPGITRDGLIRHFFHRPSKAYTTGTRKRRKIQTECDEQGGETRWHKTGKTRPVLINGKQKGCKKILVLYTNFGKHRKPEKTNWVMHQYHLGSQEEEKEGELVVSKVFYQTQPRQCNWEKGTDSGDNTGIAAACKALSTGITDQNPTRLTPDTAVKIGTHASISNRLNYTNYNSEQQLEATGHYPLVPSSREISDQGLVLNVNSSRRDQKKRSDSSQCTHSCDENMDLHLNRGVNASKHLASINRKEEWGAGESNSVLDENVTRLLHCDETIQVSALSNTNFVSYGSQDLDDLAADLGLMLEEHQRHKTAGMPSQKDALEDIFMDTPPGIKEEPLTNTYETDWIKSSFWPDSDSSGHHRLI